MIKTTVKWSKFVFCTYLSHFSIVLDDFFFGSTRQIKHPIFTGQGAGQLFHTPGMTCAIAYLRLSSSSVHTPVPSVTPSVPITPEVVP